MIKVILLNDSHTHNKIKLNLGDVIELEDKQAEFLIKNSVAKLADKTKKIEKE